MVDEVHKNFNAAVLAGRHGKLTGDNQTLFSGDFWTGTQALKLGLVDAIGNLPDVLENEFKVSRYRDYSDSSNLLKKLAGQLGASLNLPLNETRFHLLSKI